MKKLFIFALYTVLSIFLILGGIYGVLKYYRHINRPVRVEVDAFGMDEAREAEVWVASALDRIFPDGYALHKPRLGKSVSLLSARQEFESFQIVVRSGLESMRDVRLELTDLVDPKSGYKIDSSHLKWYSVGYVPTQKPYYPTKHVGLWPDPLWPEKPVTISPVRTQSFWVTVHTPGRVPASSYKGKVRVISGETVVSSIPVEVEVLDFTLPPRSSLTTAFGFYDHILYLRYPRQEGETEPAYRRRLEGLREEFIAMMLKFRMDPILNLDLQKLEDLERLEKYREAGLGRFSIGRHGGTFGNNWPPDLENNREMRDRYERYAEILRERDLMERHYIYTWDEGGVGNPGTREATAWVHDVDQDFKNLVCEHAMLDTSKDGAWARHIDIWCFQSNYFDVEGIQNLQRQGKEVWMYVSGPNSDGSPNLAMDRDSMEYRVLPWISWKFNLQGFLYWCVNWWEKVDPFKTAANTRWEQNGNGLMMYPAPGGPIPSIRMMLWRDGMEDYEYFALLLSRRSMATALNRPVPPGWLESSAKELGIDPTLIRDTVNYSRDPEPFLKKRERVGRLIAEVSGNLQ